MRCVRTPIEADVNKYELGAGYEDGFELYADVITKDNVNIENLVQVDHEGMLSCPYILTRRGKTFIKEGDYIIVSDDGTKSVCGEDKIFKRYKQI